MSSFRTNTRTATFEPLMYCVIDPYTAPSDTRYRSYAASVRQRHELSSG